jgi:hypothetical protein
MKSMGRDAEIHTQRGLRITYRCPLPLPVLTVPDLAASEVVATQCNLVAGQDPMVRALRAAGYESNNMEDQMDLVLFVQNPFLDASFPCLPTKSWTPYISGLHDLLASVQFPSTRETTKGSRVKRCSTRSRASVSLRVRHEW